MYCDKVSGAQEHRPDGGHRRDRHQRRGGGRQPRQGQRVRRHAPGQCCQHQDDCMETFFRRTFSLIFFL